MRRQAIGQDGAMTEQPYALPALAGAEGGDADHASFPRRMARTQRFTLGIPRAFTVSPDGDRVVFLRSASGTERTGLLWVARRRHRRGDAGRRPGRAARRERRRDADAEERARRERMREGGAGITSYSDRQGGRAGRPSRCRPGCSSPTCRRRRARAPRRRPRHRPAALPRRQPGGLRRQRRPARRRHARRRRAAPWPSPTGSTSPGGSRSSSPARSWTATAGTGGCRTAPAAGRPRRREPRRHLVGGRPGAPRDRAVRPPLPGRGHRRTPRVPAPRRPRRHRSRATCADHDAFPYLVTSSSTTSGRRSWSSWTATSSTSRSSPSRTTASGRCATSRDDAWVDVIPGSPQWWGERLLTVEVSEDTYRLCLDGKPFSPVGTAGPRGRRRRRRGRPGDRRPSTRSRAASCSCAPTARTEDLGPTGAQVTGTRVAGTTLLRVETLDSVGRHDHGDPCRRRVATSCARWPRTPASCPRSALVAGAVRRRTDPGAAARRGWTAGRRAAAR